MKKKKKKKINIEEILEKVKPSRIVNTLRWKDKNGGINYISYQCDKDGNPI